MNRKEPGDQKMERPRSLLECIWLVGCFAPILAVFGLVAWVVTTLLQSGLHWPLWLGVSIGMAVGGLVILFLKLANYDNWVELSGTCVLIIILAAILRPVFMREREKNLRQRKKQQQSGMSTGGSAHHAAPSAGPPASTSNHMAW
jgi:ABC-type Fe3+ transport system permease subunit